MKLIPLLWLAAALAFMEHPSWPLGLLLAVPLAAWLTWPHWWPPAK